MEAILMIAMALPPILLGVRILLMFEADNDDVNFNDWNFGQEQANNQNTY